MKKIISKTIIGIVLSSAVSFAHAIPVNFSIKGTVNNTQGMNQFGLNVGDSVSANAIFDDSLLSSRSLMFGMFGNAFGSSLTLNIGSQTYTESDDFEFLLRSPTLRFDINGDFSGFDFASDTFFATNRFVTSRLEFFGTNAGIENVTGTWNLDTASITPVTSVPEPSSILLLSLGVLGLVGAKKNKYMK